MGQPSRQGKTALVLSAGGLFCSYQAGVFAAISSWFKPDLVVGVSAGALNGWPIASGCSAEGLAESWLDPSFSDVLHYVPRPGLRRGWLDPEPLREVTEKIVARFKPRIPFGLVVVEAPSLATHLVKWPDATARHLQASCSIPLVLPPVRIGQRRFLDGGLFEKLPVWAAVEMGATRIVAVDCLPSVGPWWLHAGINIARVFKPRRPQVPKSVDVTTITCPDNIGTAHDALFWKRENIERWLDLGYRDATRAFRAAA